ncbi:putative replication protein [Caudoviricetes sp.]|nr:putative replication protein [Caudoviricetes sp.]
MTFAEFWKQYPRKVSKREAEKAWNKLPPVDQDAALEALPQHIKYWQLKDTSSEFIPHASTWLNQARFEDELDMTEKAQKAPKLPWYSTEQLTLEKGREVGINPNPGEDFGQFRSRIAKRIAELA